jgi:hypothetical protein
LAKFPRRFSFKISYHYTSTDDNTPCWCFASLEDNLWGGCRLDPRNSKQARTFPASYCTLKFLWRGGVSCYSTPLLIVVFPQGQSDITLCRPWSSTATGNHLDHAEKFQNLLSWLATLTFLKRVRHFGSHFAESFSISKPAWMIEEPNPLPQTSYLPSQSHDSWFYHRQYYGIPLIVLIVLYNWYKM